MAGVQGGNVEIRDFVEQEYFPQIRATLSISTVCGYNKIWRGYGHYLDAITFDAKVADCQKILRNIAQDNPNLRRSTIRHTKAFFSGIFTAALQSGRSENGSNPWRATKLPNAAESNETAAYSPEDVRTMLSVLPPPADLIVLTMAFTGMRKSEGRAIKWLDIDFERATLSVQRAAWCSVIKNTKSKASKAAVPLAPDLLDKLKEYRKKKPKDTFVFSNRKGAPLDFDLLARRVIIPALAETKVRWAGWHALRRGLATTLHSSGVADKEIQKILRHEQVSTTQACYIKTLPENIRAAMATISFQREGNQTPVTEGSNGPSVALPTDVRTVTIPSPLDTIK